MNVFQSPDSSYFIIRVGLFSMSTCITGFTDMSNVGDGILTVCQNPITHVYAGFFANCSVEYSLLPDLVFPDRLLKKPFLFLCAPCSYQRCTLLSALLADEMRLTTSLDRVVTENNLRRRSFAILYMARKSLNFRQQIL